MAGIIFPLKPKMRQLQTELKLTLIESPAVSVSASYKQLCIMAKHKEKGKGSYDDSSNSKTNR